MKLMKRDPVLPERTKIMAHAIDAIMADKEAWEAITKWQPDFMDDDSRRHFEYVIDENIFQEIDLSLEDWKILNGYFTLYTKFGFPVEGVVTSWANFYKACGVKTILKKDGKKDFPGREIKKIFKHLLRLTMNSVTICYKRKNPADSKRGELVVVRNEPLCKFVRLYYRLSDDQIKHLPEKYRKLYLEKIKENKFLRLVHFKLNPILIEDPTFFRMYDANIYEELKEVKEKENKRVSKYDFNFFFWMLRQTQTKVEINMLKLAKIIKLPESAIKKKVGYVREFLKEIYETFKTLGYITQYELDVPAVNGGYKDIIYLNPEKLTHLKTAIVKK